MNPPMATSAIASAASSRKRRERSGDAASAALRPRWYRAPGARRRRSHTGAHDLARGTARSPPAALAIGPQPFRRASRQAPRRRSAKPPVRRAIAQAPTAPACPPRRPDARTTAATSSARRRRLSHVSPVRSRALSDDRRACRSDSRVSRHRGRCRARAHAPRRRSAGIHTGRRHLTSARPRDHIGERLGVDELHHDIRAAVGLADFVNRADGRMRWTDESARRPRALRGADAFVRLRLREVVKPVLATCSTEARETIRRERLHVDAVEDLD